MTGLRAVDLFCGVGGFAYGMQKAGIEIVRSLDHDPAVLEVHAINVKHVKYRLAFWPPLKDATRPELRSEKPFQRGQIHRSRRRQHVADLGAIVDVAPEIAQDAPEVIFGGPPCQAFSRAGKREGDNDPRSTLSEAFAIIVAASRPKYFVMENVKGLRKSETFKRAKSVLKRAGYGLTEIVVNASYFGTPQSRERLILAGCLDETDGWFFAYINQYKTRDPLTVADVMGPDFGTSFADFALDPNSTDAIRIEDVGEYRGYRLRKSDHSRLDGRDQTSRYYYCTPGGASSAAVHRVDRPAPTLIRTSTDPLAPTYRPLVGDPVDLRRIAQPTFEEFAQLGGYPIEWNWGKTRSELREAGNLDSMLLGARQRQLMLANSVPPPLAYAIGRALRDHHSRKIPTMPVEAQAIADGKWKISRRELERYAKWLRVAKALSGKALSQELSDLRAAKRIVSDRQLQSAADEIRAFDTLPATSESQMQATRKSQLRRALSNLQEFEFYRAHVRIGLFPDNDEYYARGGLDFMLNGAPHDDDIDDQPPSPRIMALVRRHQDDPT